MRTYVHLSVQERMLIYEWEREGVSQAEMGRRLGRSKATISRELRRDAVAAGYLPDMAQRRYRARRQRCCCRPRLDKRRLRQTMLLLLQRSLSPEQISGRLRAKQGGTVINHETIYRFVYESPLGRQEKLYEYLRRGMKKRTRRQGRRGHASPIAERLSIPARPLAANDRTEIGHWESDSLLFSREHALNVLAERCSRFILLTHLAVRTAEDTRRVLVEQLSGCIPGEAWPASGGAPGLEREARDTSLSADALRHATRGRHAGIGFWVEYYAQRDCMDETCLSCSRHTPKVARQEEA